MRLDRTQRLTAEEIVARWPAERLAGIFREYGDQPFARRIALAIVDARRRHPIHTTDQLAEIVLAALPAAFRKAQRQHPATRVFQALRIAVNEELASLETFFDKIFDCLKPGGRVVVIAFHSGEDRIVKNRLRQAALEGRVRLAVRKPITPTPDEVRTNPQPQCTDAGGPGPPGRRLRYSSMSRTAVARRSRAAGQGTFVAVRTSRGGGNAVGRETKFGLLVGLVFIILFGVILSSRAGSSTTDHAVLPTGESQAHATRVQSLHTAVDPFAQEGTLDVRGTAPVEVAEESLPAPSEMQADTPPAPRTDDTVTVGYGPVTVETPTTGDRVAMRGTRPEAPADGAPPAVRGTAPAAPASDPSRPVYVVKAGDTLSSIAHQFYGKDWPKLWQGIVDANKGALKDPKRLPVGQKLVIPNVPAATPKADTPKTDVPNKAGTPKTDAPAAPPAIRDYGDDTALAIDGRPVPRTADDLRRALREVTVPADGRTPPRVVPVTALTADDVGRMSGATTDTPAPAGKTYAIQAGDTFNKIAAKLYGDGSKYGKLLAQKNPGVDPTRLKIGQRIVLLDGVASAAAPAAASAADTVVALR